MENDEKEDLLLEVTESEDEAYEKEEIDYYIEKKMLEYIQTEKPSGMSRKKILTFIATCLFLFLSSSVLIVTLPIYFKYSTLTNITTYSKLVTLALTNAVFFVVAHVIGVLSKLWSHRCSNNSLYLPEFLKTCSLHIIGSVLIFWLTDGSYVSCHLKDPLKGCSIVFSLFFYYVFSRKKMSLERTFCAITVIVGVFISVDFGLCDKFHCNGNSNLTESTPKLHFLYVVFYILAHGIWVLHFVLVEVYWTTYKSGSSNLNVSLLSNVTNSLNSGAENTKPSIQSLSLICQEEQNEQMTRKIENETKIKSGKKSFFCTKSPSDVVNCSRELENSLKNLESRANQLSIPNFKNFPLTSTPNNETDAWHFLDSVMCHDIALWQHISCCIAVTGLSWLPTLSIFHSGKSKLLIDVVNEIISSIRCHLDLGNCAKCYYLPIITVIVSLSYVVLILSSIKVLRITESAVTVVSIMMAALPLASLFWSLFRLNGGEADILEFSPEITGEAVCAILGLPIIGIGIILLMKSHIREFVLVV